MVWIANSITLLSLIFGIISITLSFGGYFTASVISILIAMILDTLDGRVARAVGRPNPLGADLDSFADLISFGLAPAFIFYTAMSMSFSNVEIFSDSPFKSSANNISLFNIQIIPFLIALLFPVCATIRLAKFNTTQFTGEFSGISTTMAAGTAALIIVWEVLPASFIPIIDEVLPTIQPPWLFVTIIYIAIALLMILPFRYAKLQKLFSFRQSRLWAFLNIFAILMIIIIYKYFLTLVFLVYLLQPVILWRIAKE
jgi:CDP-diacylglycerol---serine O-phosphatidyltransferase